MNKINILTKQQEDIVCKLLHYARSEEVVQHILNTVGRPNWTRDILSSCVAYLTKDQEDIQASIGYGYTAQELDELVDCIDDIKYEIKEILKSQGITSYLYENEEYLEEIRRGTIICEGININEIKKMIWG